MKHISKILLAVTLIALIAFMPSELCTPASAQLDTVSYYEDGLIFFECEEYEAAYESFSQALGYKDSVNWQVYCAALLSIEESDIQTAAANLELLAAQEFEQAEKWLTYCYARDAQSIGNYNYARQLYKTLLGVGDSLDRYNEMHARIMGVYDGPEEEKSLIAPEKQPIDARVTSYISIYAGPGSHYMKLPFKIDTDHEIWVYDGYRTGSSSWYMIGFERDGQPYRAWASTARVDADKNVPWAAAARAAKCTLTEEVCPLYGPGDDFAPHAFTLKKGALVSVVGAEGAYSLLDIKRPTDDKPAYVWVPTEKLK